MKELKFNLRYLSVRKELYITIISVLLINAVHVLLVIQNNAAKGSILNITKAAEYQFILNNPFVTIMSIIIITFPVLTSMISADTSWLETKRKTNNLLFIRLNYKKNIFVRWWSSMLITFVIIFIGFMLNYVSLVFIYGSGNLITNFQMPAFLLSSVPEFFIDNIRFANPVLFAVLISLHESLLFSLLVGLSYLLSFFSRQRLAIYFQVLLAMIFLEVFLSSIGLENISIIKQLQPFSKFSVNDAIVMYAILFILNIVPLTFIQMKKGDLIV